MYNLLSNPIVLGVIVFILGYAYYWYEKRERMEKTKANLQMAINNGALSFNEASYNLYNLQEEKLPLKKILILSVIVAVSAYLYKCNSKDSKIYDNNAPGNMYSDISDKLTLV